MLNEVSQPQKDKCYPIPLQWDSESHQNPGQQMCVHKSDGRPKWASWDGKAHPQGKTQRCQMRQESFLGLIQEDQEHQLEETAHH